MAQERDLLTLLLHNPHKRFGDAPSLYQALGVLAYCQSFKKICAERCTPHAFATIPNFNDQASADSMRARAEEGVAQHAESSANAAMRLSKAANWRTFTLAGVAIIIAYLAILVQPRIGQERFTLLNRFSDYASEHFLTIGIVSFLVLTLTWALTHSAWVTKCGWGRDILEVANVSRAYAIGIGILATAAILAITYFIARLAIADLVGAILALFRLVS